MYSPLEVFSDLSERLNYNRSDFPLYARKDRLSRYEYKAVCHWHPDLEFIYVLDGSMDYFVNGKIVRISTNDGIFVNSRRLHYGFSNNKLDCTFVAVIINPKLLLDSSQMMNAYLSAKFGLETEDFVSLDCHQEWQRQVLLLINQIYGKMQTHAYNPLRVLSQAIFLCSEIGDRLHRISRNRADVQLQNAVWKMTGFIHKHYDEKITLNEIAATGAVCRSRCCKLFNQYVGQTPSTYLMKYRIAESCKMLHETSRSISEIAAACGFQSPSYFSYVFRREIELAPQEYRKRYNTCS